MLARDVAQRLYEGRLPQFQKITPHEIQTYSVDKLSKPEFSRHILGLPMGVGKTWIGVEALKKWAPRRSLLIPTERAILSWLKTMWVWHPEMLDRYLIMGKMYDKRVREQFIVQQAKNPDLSIITNYQLLIRDRDFYPKHWDSIVLDEYHKFMRNRNTGMHKLLRTMKSDKLLLVSGSPSTKGAIDFFVPFNLIDPKLFSSYWKFARTWANIDETPFGKSVWGTRNEEQFNKLLQSYAIIKSKKQLNLQKKVREVVPVQMSATQERAYRQIRDDFLLELESQPPQIMLNTLSQYTKLRKLLSCPAALAPELGIGGGAQAVAEMLADLPVEDRHCTIFTPFRDNLPLIKAYLEGEGHAVGLPDSGTDMGVPVFLFQGGMGMENLFEALHQFKTRKGIAVCTVDFAESFDMETTDKAFFLGCSWDPQVNFQAEDRLDRLNNPHGLINIYYMMHSGTLDEEVMYALAMKQTNVNQLYSNNRSVADALKAN